MRFSDQFGVKRGPKEKWFDPILSVDTLLFVDPFLLYAREEGVFKGSHAEVIAFFNHAFELIAACKGEERSIKYRKAVDDLRFPEVEELCLGYTGAGTKGSGSGRDLAKLIASSIWEAIEAGVKEITHFEEVGILREGIGADRISDITAGILRERLARYTEDICTRLKIKTSKVNYARGKYDLKKRGWVPVEAELPENPFNKKHVLLVPQNYLRDLPTINAFGFWDYCLSNENDTIRNEFNFDVSQNVSKHDIIEIARKHPEFRRDYLKQVEKLPSESYNFEADRKGYVQWYDATADHAKAVPLKLEITSKDALKAAIEAMCKEFQHYVEENQGWGLLWNDNRTPRHEKSSQLLFLGIIKHYCKANDIDISKEPNIGRGPVDFKVSKGYRLRALLEAKLARNTKFWNGIKAQLPTYLKAEEIEIGYCIVIVYNDADEERIAGIQETIKVVMKETGRELKAIIVDARPDKPSASKL